MMEITTELDINKRTASYTYGKYCQNYDFYLEGHKSGCLHKFTPHDLCIVDRAIQNGEAVDASNLQCQKFPNVSAQTVSCALTDIGLPV